MVVGALAMAGEGCGGSQSSPQPTENHPAYSISGTCTNGSCFVNEREAPTENSAKISELKEGQGVDIICQERGQKIAAPDGTPSSMWDEIKAPAGPGHVAYISDLFVDTPAINQFSANIPHC